MLAELKRVILLIVLSGAVGCSHPHPRAPEVIEKQAAERRHSPLIVKLELTPHKAEELEKLFAEAREFLTEYEKARIELIDEAVVEIEAGTLDREKLEPLARRAITEWEAKLPQLTAAANRLHALLGPEKRRLLIEILGGKERNLSDEEKRQARQDRISKLLDLNSGQKTRLFGTILGLTITHYSLVQDTRAAIREAQESFVKDDYDATKLAVVTSLDLNALAELAYEALVEGLEVLTPQQHKTLAAVLRTRLLRRTTESAHPELVEAEKTSTKQIATSAGIAAAKEEEGKAIAPSQEPPEDTNAASPPAKESTDTSAEETKTPNPADAELGELDSEESTSRRLDEQEGY